jgi:hypothetical protein
MGRTGRPAATSQGRLVAIVHAPDPRIPCEGTGVVAGFVPLKDVIPPDMDVDKPSTFTEPLVDDRVRLDPLDPKTARHMGQCEFASADDSSVLRVLASLAEGQARPGGGLRLGRVRRVWRWLAGSALRRERRVTTNLLLRHAPLSTIQIIGRRTWSL